MKRNRSYRQVISMGLTAVLLALMPVVLSAVLLACSNDKDDIGEDASPMGILSRFNAEGKAWLCLQIQTNDQSLTRAETDDNGQFADGANETIVSSESYVLVFAGSNESTATFAGIYKAEKESEADDTSDGQITKTVQISNDNITRDDNLYVLVLLNYNGGIFGLNTLSTFSDLQDVLISPVEYTSASLNYFAMTNAVLSSSPGGTSDPTGAAISTLVKIDASKFYYTKEDAIVNPAATINVERLAAKVTVGVSDDISHKIFGNADIDYADADFSFAIDNYNETSRICKVFDDSWFGYSQQPDGNSAYKSSADYYRFVETNPISTVDAVYRTYWGEDVNYGAAATDLTYVDQTAYEAFTDAERTAYWKSMDESDYCAENTMSLPYMTDENTTSVLVRLQLNGGNVFYTTSVTGSDVIFQKPNSTITEEGTSASSSFAKGRKSTFVTPDATNYPNGITIDSYLRQWLVQFSTVRDWLDKYAAGNPDYISFTTADETVAGDVTFTATQNATTNSTAVAEWSALNVDGLLTDITISQYPEGYCYYRVHIKHFGDELTPWKSASTMDKTDMVSVYGNGTDVDEAKYLGRYGVVRNNWYTITITDVSHVGSPTIPALTSYADDVVEELINTKVVVSKWTVHSQEMSF